jgi:hypothetical protein
MKEGRADKCGIGGVGGWGGGGVGGWEWNFV